MLYATALSKIISQSMFARKSKNGLKLPGKKE